MEELEDTVVHTYDVRHDLPSMVPDGLLAMAGDVLLLLRRQLSLLLRRRRRHTLCLARFVRVNNLCKIRPRKERKKERKDGWRRRGLRPAGRRLIPASTCHLYTTTTNLQTYWTSISHLQIQIISRMIYACVRICMYTSVPRTYVRIQVFMGAWHEWEWIDEQRIYLQ